jgi:hypothetical protein
VSIVDLPLHLEGLMSENLKQFGFRCTPEFAERLHAEQERRSMSLQQLIIEALERYLSISDELDKWAKSPKPVSPWFDSPSERELVALLFSYVRKLPARKLQLTLETLALDLRHYRSSRFNADRFQRDV